MEFKQLIPYLLVLVVALLMVKASASTFLLGTASPDEAANIISLTPAYGLNDAPTAVYIKGNNFFEPVTVMLGTQRLRVTNVISNEQPNQLRVIVPAGLESGAYDVTVQTAFGVASAPNGYDVLGETDDLLSSSDWMWTEPFPLRVGFTQSSVGLLVQHLGGSTTVDSVTVEFRLERPDGDLLGRSLTNLLAPNATESSGPVTWQPDAPGEYTICALIDPDNQVEETDEENNITCHSFTVLPYPVGDTEPPEVERFSIQDDAQTTQEEAVTVDIAATDYPDPGASGMEASKIVEFEYSYGARRWVPVKQSTWENYFNTQNDYPWTLRETYGMRYVQAWVADKKRNISLKPGTDVIDLLPSEQADYVAKDGVTFYRIRLEAGESFSATMTPVEGEPEMFVWGPNSQVWHSDNATGVEDVSFNAPVEGTYQIEIHGTTNAQYRLTFGQTTLVQTRSIQHPAGGREIPTEPAVPLDDWPEYYDIDLPAPIEENIEENMIYLPLTIR